MNRIASITAIFAFAIAARAAEADELLTAAKALAATPYTWTAEFETPDAPFRLPAIKGRSQPDGALEVQLKSGSRVIRATGSSGQLALQHGLPKADAADEADLLATLAPADELRLLAEGLAHVQLRPDGSLVGDIDSKIAATIMARLVRTRAPMPGLKTGACTGQIVVERQDGKPPPGPIP